MGSALAPEEIGDVEYIATYLLLAALNEWNLPRTAHLWGDKRVWRPEWVHARTRRGWPEPWPYRFQEELRAEGIIL